jgi:GNAT superfamily N-acetyltransferase
MEAALAAAFVDDPAQSFLLPEADRETRLRRFFHALIPFYDAALVNEQPAGAALWASPGRWPLPAGEQLAALPPLARVYRRHPRRALGALLAVERGHIHEPHYYLDYIGVEPAGQGTGAGSALLTPVLERCDGERRPAYLNASSPRSRDLYARHGFEVLSEFRLPFGGPPLWRMRYPVRRPRSA